MSNEVLKNDTAITLDWTDVTGANLYHLQVATKVDFSGSLIVNDSALATSGKSFTESGADDSKRWWRWRSSTDSGTTWSEWSQVGHYWYNSAAAGDVLLAADKWAIFDPALVTDIYTFPDFPSYQVIPNSIYRAKERNRLGNMLTEWKTSKDFVRLGFSRENYMRLEQACAFLRFHTVVKTFFIAAYKYNGIDYVPHIWKGIFTENPSMVMLAAGRPDLLTGDLNFEEA